MHRSVRRGLLVAALVLGAGCGDDSTYDRSTTTQRSTTEGGAPAEGEPPTDFDALSALFAPALDEVGLELSRASIVELETGPHIALYGVPAPEDGGPEDYLARLLPSIAAAGQIAFDGFEAVQSFDLCQEPTVTTNVDTPPPVTIAVLTREQWESVPDWTDATLVDLLRAVSLGDGGQLEVPDEIGELDEWQAAVDEFHARD